jgi:hypothetical protein
LHVPLDVQLADALRELLGLRSQLGGELPQQPRLLVRRRLQREQLAAQDIEFV